MPKRGYGLGLLFVQGLGFRALGFSGFSRALCGNLYKGLEFRDVWGLGFVQVSFCKEFLVREFIGCVAIVGL